MYIEDRGVDVQVFIFCYTERQTHRLTVQYETLTS